MIKNYETRLCELNKELERAWSERENYIKAHGEWEKLSEEEKLALVGLGVKASKAEHKREALLEKFARKLSKEDDRIVSSRAIGVLKRRKNSLIFAKGTAITLGTIVKCVTLPIELTVYPVITSIARKKVEFDFTYHTLESKLFLPIEEKLQDIDSELYSINTKNRKIINERLSERE